MFTGLWDWIVAVFHEWQVYVTGGAFAAGLLVWQALRHQALSWRFIGWFLLVVLVFAFFKAWQGEYLKVVAFADLRPRFSITSSELEKVLARDETPYTLVFRFQNQLGRRPAKNMRARIVVTKQSLDEKMRC